MCGIVAVVRRPPAGAPPELTPLLHDLDAVVERLAGPGAESAEALREAAATIGAVARTLRGPLSAGALIADPVASAAFDHRAAELGERFAGIEAALDQAADTGVDVDDVEARNAALIECKDAIWALRCDRLATARAIEELAGRRALGAGALAGYSLDPDRAFRARPARGARPRLRRTARPDLGSRPRPR